MNSTLLKTVNTQLYAALESLIHAHEDSILGAGGVYYSDSAYANIEDDLDLLAVNYFGNTPDGDRQEEHQRDRIANGDELMSDIEAYRILTNRLANTIIS